MSKKDYEKAALIVQNARKVGQDHADDIENAFVRFFADDNERFDEYRFRRACIIGANVRSRRAA